MNHLTVIALAAALLPAPLLTDVALAAGAARGVVADAAGAAAVLGGAAQHRRQQAVKKARIMKPIMAQKTGFPATHLRTGESRLHCRACLIPLLPQPPRWTS